MKQDIATMRKQNSVIKGHQKLFRYYFLHLWREKQHKNALADKPELRNELVQSSQALFDEMSSQGVVLEEFGAKTFYLSFNLSSEINHSGFSFNEGITPGF